MLVQNSKSVEGVVVGSGFSARTSVYVADGNNIRSRKDAGRYDAVINP